MKEDEYTSKQDKLPEEPAKEKIYKTRQEKVKAERSEFVPIQDAKITVEVEAIPRPTIEQIETIERPGKKGQVRKKQSEKFPVKKAKRVVVEKVKTKNIETLSGNSILVVTEKPQAAQKIASALSGGRELKKSDNGIPFYEFERKNEHIIVACAVGHLFSLSQDVKGSDYPIFEISWKPNFEVRKKDFTKKYYTLLGKLVKRAKEIVVATDYDVEGEVIGYNIVRFIGRQKDAKRMKYSSLTKNELEEAFENIHPTIDWGQAIAGETRHFTDWYYGINLSRALMAAFKSTGKFRILSIGRVQGPALKMIVEKEKSILNFKPQKYWKIFIDILDKGQKLRLRHVKDIFEESLLPKFNNLKNKIANVKTDKHLQSITPPFPFDLTTLQTEAYKHFSLNPAKTLEIAQRLYLAGIISYPRTSSQKIPEAINPKSIVKRLAKYYPEAKFAVKDKPVEGKKSDPAHPSIYPTGEHQELEGEDAKLYELIVKRFLACFAENAQIENKTITAESEGLLFKEKGAEIIEPGWMNVYPGNIIEKEIKDINGKYNIEEVIIEEDETKPPKRYSPASIISELESRNLGTKATRANIIETLYDRGYVTDIKSIRATPLGINLIDTLEKFSPIIIDEKLTRETEKSMDALRVTKKELDKKQIEILDKQKKALIEISHDFKEKEKDIGNELVKAMIENRIQEQKDNEIMPCPVCKKGKLAIKYSPKNRKHFVACNAYPDCKTTFSLPPFGVIKLFNKPCDKCGFNLLMSLRKGKRPWVFCFNPNCPSRQEKVKQESSEESEE